MTLARWMGKKKPRDASEEANLIDSNPPQSELNQFKIPPVKDDAHNERLKQKIRGIIGKQPVSKIETINDVPVENFEEKESTDAVTESEFLNELARFKTWISTRTYLKGDFDTAGTMVTALATIYAKIRDPAQENEDKSPSKFQTISTIELYKRVPPDFLPENERKALYRLIKGKIEKKDYYHLRALQEAADQAAKSFQIYQIILVLVDRAKLKAKLIRKKS